MTMTCVSGSGWNNVAALKAIDGGACEKSYTGTGKQSKSFNGSVIIDGLIKQKKGGAVVISCSTSVFSLALFIIFLFY